MKKKRGSDRGRGQHGLDDAEHREHERTATGRGWGEQCTPMPSTITSDAAEADTLTRYAVATRRSAVQASARSRLNRSLRAT
ncbi:hypothetical protein [Burkholderia glumae]|uniref:hypothetical protein n=1 Tax=Burkholderia glumae TaxID=337 RepID=UPI00031EFB5A|nr:hypothetical protein [Burkholderia glumae]PJO21673.1 hypothetical protein Y5A_018410 [Burkholderia glumae AU6208]QHE10618.1 hypothetical protein GQR88_09535 [Burkholderia glumae AU6208]